MDVKPSTFQMNPSFCSDLAKVLVLRKLLLIPSNTIFDLQNLGSSLPRKHFFPPVSGELLLDIDYSAHPEMLKLFKSQINLFGEHDTLVRTLVLP